jgi:hypothetical protein
VASAYTESPSCFATSVQVPYAVAEVTEPELEVPESDPSVYTHTVGVSVFTITVRPLVAMQVMGTDKGYKRSTQYGPPSGVQKIPWYSIP